MEDSNVLGNERIRDLTAQAFAKLSDSIDAQVSFRPA
jgi:hypothetical protein